MGIFRPSIANKLHMYVVTAKIFIFLCIELKTEIIKVNYLEENVRWLFFRCIVNTKVSSGFFFRQKQYAIVLAQYTVDM